MEEGRALIDTYIPYLAKHYISMCGGRRVGKVLLDVIFVDCLLPILYPLRFFYICSSIPCDLLRSWRCTQPSGSPAPAP